jgi:hypothetical protein
MVSFYTTINKVKKLLQNILVTGKYGKQGKRLAVTQKDILPGTVLSLLPLVSAFRLSRYI